MNRHRFTAVLIFLSVMILATANYSYSSDNLSKANIFMFPKSHPVGEMTFATPSGKPLSTNDLRGKVVLLHFWSIQCPACRMEEPLLEQLKKTYGGSGLEILGVNLVDPPDAIARYAASNRIPFPVVFDGGRGYSLKGVNLSGKRTAFLVNSSQEALLEVPGFPTTYILDCRGAAIGFTVGAARWDDASAQAMIQKLLVDQKTCSASNTQPQSQRYSMR